MDSGRRQDVPLGQRRGALCPAPPAVAGDVGLEAWLLACAVWAHPAAEVPFADLVRLPELFPFRFAIGVDGVRRSSLFEVQRQGAGWNMVRTAG
jgi:hypothetical protein